VIEFGLRRSQGVDGGLTAARAACIGGCAGASNLQAGERFGIPVSGRQAHSWVMFFENEFEAFSVNCAHLGCPVRWLPDARLFMCPCHGGVYYEDGSVAAGPPPHGLTKYPVRVKDGRVEIRTDPIPIG